MPHRTKKQRTRATRAHAKRKAKPTARQKLRISKRVPDWSHPAITKRQVARAWAKRRKPAKQPKEPKNFAVVATAREISADLKRGPMKRPTKKQIKRAATAKLKKRGFTNGQIASIAQDVKEQRKLPQLRPSLVSAALPTRPPAAPRNTRRTKAIEQRPTPSPGNPTYQQREKEKPCAHVISGAVYDGNGPHNRTVIESRPIIADSWRPDAGKVIGRRRRIKCKKCNARWTETTKSEATAAA
jgi:hypothetical protein